MVMLVSLEQAKRMLRIDGTAHDANLELLISAASQRVLHHIDSDQDFLDSYGEPDEETDGVALDVPADIAIAVIYLVGVLLKDPDGEKPETWDPGWLPPACTSMLYPYRTPTLA